MIADPKTLSLNLLLHIANTLEIPVHGVVAVIELLDDGGTVPFIARYRKEVTGNLDEVKVRSIEQKVEYFRELVARRETILASIADQGKLTDELKTRIEATFDKSELEDLYLPYRPKRRTKATVAREKGLEPLALYVWAQQPGVESLDALARNLVNAEKGVNSAEEALEGARHIVAELISEEADLRKALRKLMFDEGVVVSNKVADAADEQEKFKMYYDYHEPVKSIPSHRMLAIRRGESEGVLTLVIELDSSHAVAMLKSRILRAPGDWTPQLQLAIEDSWGRLLNSSIQAEIRSEVKERSDGEAIQVFRDNLHNLLLAPPAGPISVLGIDPGVRTGCKLAVIDETGKFLAHDAMEWNGMEWNGMEWNGMEWNGMEWNGMEWNGMEWNGMEWNGMEWKNGIDVIYLHRSKGEGEAAASTLAGLVERYNVRAIAIGNGTASRETAAFVGESLRQRKLDNVFSVTVSESGASVYSASEVARQEFPDLDLTARGAISIARRLQDPLSELVKVDPKSIGVGQYQHDVDQRQLHQSLATVIESCVNRVGVDLNTSSWTLLRYVAGVTERTAQNIVTFRNENGSFRSRTQLRKVPGVGPKTFEQAAGFLRIRNGDNLLDMTAVHPESYQIVEQIAQSLSVPIEELIKRPELLEKVDRNRVSAGTYTLNDILEELRKPGRDPRDKFVAPSFNEQVRELSDLQPGMVLEGIVTNVTKFGAFVDVGVHQDGLVHISELSNRYIKDASDVVKAGQIVKVKVLSADPKTKRISLSIKALQEPPAKRPPKQERKSKPKPQPKPEPTFEEKVAMLAAKWKPR